MRKYLYCLVCNKPLDGKKAKYCSIVCKNKSLQGYLNQKQRGLKRKLDLIKKAGGKCCVCGYSKNLSALTFHHKDKNNKSFKLDMRSLSNRKIGPILLENKKCILVCHNCHAELHNPTLSLKQLL